MVSITASVSLDTPAGIARPRPPPTWMLYPNSFNVGTSGKFARRCSAGTASMRSFFASTPLNTSLTFSMVRSTCLPITAAIASAPLLNDTYLNFAPVIFSS